MELYLLGHILRGKLRIIRIVVSHIVVPRGLDWRARYAPPPPEINYRGIAN